MAEQALITRRAAFVGALASTAALAVPAAGAVNRPSEGDRLIEFLDTASPDELITYHATRLAEALCEARPGLWRFTLRDVQKSGLVAFNHVSSDFTGYAQDFQ